MQVSPLGQSNSYHSRREEEFGCVYTGAAEGFELGSLGSWCDDELTAEPLGTDRSM